MLIPATACLGLGEGSKKEIFSQRDISWSERTESPSKLCSLSVYHVSPALLRRGAQRLLNCICHKSLTFQKKKKKDLLPSSAQTHCLCPSLGCSVVHRGTDTACRGTRSDFWLGFCRPKWCLDSHTVRANTQFLNTYPSGSECPLRP